MDSRGLTPLIGLVLLFGMVAIGSIIILVTAVPLVDDAQQTAETERVEQSMVNFNQDMNSLTHQGDSPQRSDLALNEYGAVNRERTGTITVESDALEHNIETVIGTVEWGGDDGTKIASEGGAVFRETGNETQIVSAPPFTYDHRTTTLNFPVINTSGDEDLGGGSMEITQLDATPKSDGTVVESENVTVTVESEYCIGWEDYFVTQAGSGSVIEECGDDETVVARMGYIDIDAAFESGITYTDPDGYGYGGNPNVTEERRWGSMYSIDDEIEYIRNETIHNEETIFLNETGESDLEDGLYYVDGIDVDDQYEFDLRNGNATLIVDGDINSGDDSIRVTERSSNNVLKMYTTGDFEADGGNAVYYDEPIPQDGSVIQLFGKSSMQLDFGPGGSPFFEGVIYAPGTTGDFERRPPCGAVQACFHSNPDFYGALVVESIHVQGGRGGLGFGYDEDNLRDFSTDIMPEDEEFSPPPQLTYLNVVEYDIKVERSG